jgi:ATP-binding cassette subfamily F protein 3
LKVIGQEIIEWIARLTKPHFFQVAQLGMRGCLALTPRAAAFGFLFSYEVGMLSIHHISKSYGIETILDDITFQLSPGERLGLVGSNGSGKTTLLRIIMGEEKPDAGIVQVSPPGLRIGYLPQGFSPDPDDTLGGFLAPVHASTEQLSEEVERAAIALSRAPDHEKLQQEYDHLISRLQLSAQNEGRFAQVLAGLGLSEFSLDTPVAFLSGGQKTRLCLARVLLSDPQLLILDEPTNHLDIAMLEWLESWLMETIGSRGGNADKSAALIVSHDRAFLDNVATGILELDASTRTIRSYPGNYTAFLEQKIEERERQWQEYTDQQEEIAHLRTSAQRMLQIAQFHKGSKGDSGDKFAKGFFGNRARGTVRRAKQLEKRLEQLMTEDRIEKPHQSWQMKLDFGEPIQSGKDVISLEDLAIGYGDLVLLEGLNQHVRYGARVALIGENGTGKTTLLRTISGVLPALKGQVRLGANIRIGYMTQEQEDLDLALNAFETILHQAPFSETETRTFLHQFLFSGDDVFTPVSKLSYGERARLSLAQLVLRGCNLLLLDEPINHLDIPSRARFEQALASFEGTVLAVVHDRYFIEGFASEIWQFQGKSLSKQFP